MQVFGLSVRAADSAVQPRQDSSRVKACFAGSVWSTASVWPESVLVRAAACAALLSLAAAAAAVAEAGDGHGMEPSKCGRRSLPGWSAAAALWVFFVRHDVTHQHVTH